MTNNRSPITSYLVPTLICLVSLALIGYDLLRVLHVSMTYDEIRGVNHIPSYRNIVLLNPVTAQTHILNSLIRKFLIETFHNTSQFMVRADNLVALILFLYSTYRLCTKIFTSEGIVLGAFLIIVLNPFMFEFWGLGRGYGLSLAFMMTSINSIVAYWQTGKRGNLLGSQVWAILAVYSNFSLLNYYLSLECTILIVSLLFYKPAFAVIRKQLPVLMICTIVLALLIVYPLYLLRRDNELYYGGDSGLIADTLQTLVMCSFHLGKAGMFAHTIIVVSVAAIVLSVFYWAFKVSANRSDTSKTGSALSLLFILPIISIFAQHILFDVKYLVDRTALFLIVLFKLMIVYTAAQFFQHRLALRSVLLAGWCTFVTANFVRLINTHHTWQWAYSDYDVDALNHILREKTNKDDKIKLRVKWLFAPSFMFYTETNYGYAFYPVEYIRGPVTEDTAYQYYYIERSDVPVLQKDYFEDTSYSNGMYVLMKRK